MKSIALAVGCTVVTSCVLSQNSAAAVINSFENPEYVPGLLDSQSGWTNHNGNATVDTANPRSGTQHVRLRNTQGALSSLSEGPAMEGGSHAISLWFSMSDVDNRFGVRGFDSSTGPDSWQNSWAISISGNTFRVEDELDSDFTATVPVVAGQYHLLSIVYNPHDASRDYFFDGVLAFHQTVGLMLGELTNAVSLDLRHSAGEFVDVDDITHGVVPSPGSVVLACMGVVMTGRRRR